MNDEQETEEVDLLARIRESLQGLYDTSRSDT